MKRNIFGIKKTVILLTAFITGSYCFAQQIDLTQFTAEQYRTGTVGVPQRAIDGDTNGSWSNGSVTHTTNNDIISWWRVDLLAEYDFSRIDVYNRTDCCSSRLNGVTVHVGNAASTDPSDYTLIGTLSGSTSVQQLNTNVTGRYICIHKDNTGQPTNEVLSIAEVHAFGALSGTTPAGGSGQWTDNGNSISYNAGNVGIGTSSPTAKLDVHGALRAEQHVTVQAGSSYKVAMNGQSDGYITGRDNSFTNKFLITAKGNSYLNGGNVGIGTSAPDAPLTVNG
ncbi:discoidin domain-containing protein [Maribacter sp. 2-571]|uniref:discoidin domain-containing protein n=1 Tax=Maribacter sp. 2-571 TaxID=3417569 RepID=UPI003D34A686